MGVCYVKGQTPTMLKEEILCFPSLCAFSNKIKKYYIIYGKFPTKKFIVHWAEGL